MDNVTTINGVNNIYVGCVDAILPALIEGRRVVVITDANIDRLYGELVHRFDYIIIGHGEANKNLLTVQNIYRELMALGADRSTLLLGIGGGIVTDITGFVASTYMRGVDFGFISTTLLGQVDASVGGKNGVNIADYKNMVGTFSQPRFVIFDVDMLSTLPQREMRAGMAEVVKAAIVGDGALFALLEREVSPEIFERRDIIEEVVTRSVRIKLDIVERDECEHGIRRLLNLGHTIGHAIEKCSREVNHGEGVAIGMAHMARAAARRGMLSQSDAERIERLLTALGFNLTPPLSLHDILREVKHDKKKAGNNIYAVLPVSIGECKVQEMSFEEFEQMFKSEYERV